MEEIQKLLADLGESKTGLESEIKAFNLDELTDEQFAEVTAKTDELEKVKSNIKDAESTLEKAKLQNRLSSLLNAENTGGQEISSQTFEPSQKRVVVPAQARARRSLKAYSSEEDAYVSGRHLAANLFGHSPSARWLQDHGIQSSALSEGNDQKGGLFVPNEMELSIVRLVEEYGVMRRYAKVSPMGSDTKTVPVRTGGMTAYAVGESNENTSSNTGTATSPTYKPVELVARKWKAWCKISDELNEDSLISMAEQISVETAQAFAYSEDNAGFNGDGTSTYNGIVGVGSALGAGSIKTLASGSLAFSDITLAEFEETIGKMPHYPSANPAWFISKAGYYASMDNLKNAAGGNTSSDLAALNQPMFMGFPVVWTQALTSTLTDQASTILGYFGDLSMATLFGDRRGMTLSVSDQRYWDEDQIAIKATERVDIVTHSAGTATAAGAVIAIKTPAS